MTKAVRNQRAFKKDGDVDQRSRQWCQEFRNRRLAGRVRQHTRQPPPIRSQHPDCRGPAGRRRRVAVYRNSAGQCTGSNDHHHAVTNHDHDATAYHHQHDHDHDDTAHDHQHDHDDTAHHHQHDDDTADHDDYDDHDHDHHDDHSGAGDTGPDIECSRSDRYQRRAGRRSVACAGADAAAVIRPRQWFGRRQQLRRRQPFRRHQQSRRHPARLIRLPLGRR